MKNNDFLNKRGQKIHYLVRIPQNAYKTGIVLHGVGEYPEVYKPLLEKLTENKIGYYAITHHGHGRSEGRRGHVRSFTDYIDDVKQLYFIAKSEGKEINFIFGHSMGGLIAIYFSIRYPELATKLILSAPALGIKRKIPLWIRIFQWPISKIWPTFSRKTKLDIEDDNPLFVDRLSAGWLTEMQKAQRMCMENAPRLKSPLYVFHSINDDLADIDKTQLFVKLSSSKPKTFQEKNYPGHHFMHFASKKERKEIFKDIITWIND